MTIAKMILCHPNGKEYKLEYDFNRDYPKSSAYFMFFEGNYSCDCNKSLFLSREYADVEEMDCGDDIVIKDFEVLDPGSEGS